MKIFEFELMVRSESKRKELEAWLEQADPYAKIQPPFDLKKIVGVIESDDIKKYFPILVREADAYYGALNLNAKRVCDYSSRIGKYLSACNAGEIHWVDGEPISSNGPLIKVFSEEFIWHDTFMVKSLKDFSYKKTGITGLIDHESEVLLCYID